MIPFPFNENRFSFFIADHLLVGQLCTNPKSDGSLLSCLKVAQCSTSHIGDAPLYNWCSLPIQVMKQDHCQHPQNANPDGSTLEGTAQRIGRPFRGGGAEVSSESHIMPLHIFEVGLKVNTKVYLDVLKSVLIPWCNQCPVADPGCGIRTWCRRTSPKRPRLGFRMSATTLYPSLTGPLLPLPEPAGLLRLVIRREHHQHDLPLHQSQPDHRHPPSIRRTPTGACGKGMIRVPDPYRGGDWGWRRLHWIDVSSTR